MFFLGKIGTQSETMEIKKYLKVLKIEEGQPFLGLVLNRAEKKAHAQRLLIQLLRALTPLM